MEEEIVQNYINPSHPTAYSGLNQVYNYYSKNHPEYRLSYKKIAEILSGIESYTRHKESKNLQRNPSFAYKKRDRLEIDLVDVRHLSKYNDGVNYLLNGIDVFTRLGFSIPLRTKTARDTLNGFKKLLHEAGEKPKTIVSDRGSEIKNKLMADFCSENGIKQFFSDTSIHCAFVERFNRSLQLLTYKFMTQNETYRYIDALPDLLKAYNNRKHRMIKLSPLQAEKPENSLKVRHENEKRYVKVRRRKPRYKVGQEVRISIQKGKFTRGYNPQQNEEVFKIKTISTTLPIPLYTLQSYDGDETIEGDFYAHELTAVTKDTFVIENIIKKKKRNGVTWLFVKWRGYKQPTWIRESDLAT